MFLQNLLAMPQKLFVPLCTVLQMVAEPTASAVGGGVTQRRAAYLKLLFLVSQGFPGRSQEQEELESK